MDDFDISDISIDQPDGTNKPCKKCGEIFFIESAKEYKNKEYCSIACKRTHRTDKNSFKAVCGFCEKEFLKYNRYKNKSKTGKFYCSIKCKVEDSKKERSFSKLSVRNWMKRRGLLQSCARCAYDEYRDILVIHHIDRNRENNSLNNLEVLCPNCHAVEHRKRWSYGNNEKRNEQLKREALIFNKKMRVSNG